LIGLVPIAARRAALVLSNPCFSACAKLQKGHKIVTHLQPKMKSEEQSSVQKLLQTVLDGSKKW